MFLWPDPRARDTAQTIPMQAPNLLVAAFPFGFVRHFSGPFLTQNQFPGHDLSYPPEATVRRCARAYSQTSVWSDGSPLTAAKSSGHVSPAVPPSSPTPAADSSTTSSRFAWATPSDATNSPGCRPVGQQAQG